MSVSSRTNSLPADVSYDLRQSGVRGGTRYYTTEVVTVLYSLRQKRHESMKYMYYWNVVYLCLTLSFAYISIDTGDCITRRLMVGIPVSGLALLH